VVAEGLRRGAVFGDAAIADQRATGVLVLGPENSIETATPGAERWLADLDAGDTAAELPVAVLAIAARARRIASDSQSDSDTREPWCDPFARARVRTARGTWATVRGSVMGAGPDYSVAVLIEEAHPAELARLGVLHHHSDRGVRIVAED
jgi:hypothetical protein